MKSGRLILAIIGGWLLFIGLDSVNGKLCKMGALMLAKPMQLLFKVTKTMRTIIIFLCAILTFLLMASHTKEDRRQCKCSSSDNEDV